MKLLGGEQRESRPGGTQIETGLRAEDRSCSRASAIGARLTFLEHEPEKIVILTHTRNYRSDDIRQNKKSVWRTTLCRPTFGSCSGRRAGCLSVLFASDTPSSTRRTSVARVALAQDELPRR